MKSPIFDHLNGEPEATRLRWIATKMRASRWWKVVPERVEPAAVAGEIVDVDAWGAPR